MKETKLLKVTVKGKTKQEIKDQFKLMTEFCDVEVEEVIRLDKYKQANCNKESST